MAPSRSVHGSVHPGVDCSLAIKRRGLSPSGITSEKPGHTLSVHFSKRTIAWTRVWEGQLVQESCEQQKFFSGAERIGVMVLAQFRAFQLNRRVRVTVVPLEREALLWPPQFC